MEKVRLVLAVLKKQLFWVLFGTLVILCTTTWLLATGHLATTFDARSRQLNNRFNEVRSTITDNHPNEEGIKKILELHGKLGDNVFEAWSHLYEQQRKLNPLPEEVKEMEGFEQEFEKRWGPLEKFDANNEMDLKYRERYANQIKAHFPILAGMIDRRHYPEEAGTPGKPGPGTHSKGPATAAQPDAQPVGTVWWDDQDFEKMEDRFFTHRKDVPNTIEVLLAQEDLWVYEALLRVIRNANNIGADPANYMKPASHKTAAVKRIMLMQIGKDAVGSWLACEQSVIHLASAGQGSGPTAVTSGGSVGVHVGTQPGTAAGTGATLATALAGRYVDDQGKPLTDPAQQPYAEFRMMPINLRVVIEQKEIPKLLAECANSNMPIEVRKCRLLVAEVPSFEPAEEATTSAGPQMPHGHKQQTLGPQRPGGPGPRAKADTSGEEEEESANPNQPAVPVEVQGIIYIYNPPDRKNLGKGTAGGAVATTGAPATGPATAPPGPGPAVPAPKPVVPAPGPAKPGPAAPVAPGPGVPPAVPPGPAPAPAPPPAKPPAPGPKVSGTPRGCKFSVGWALPTTTRSFSGDCPNFRVSENGTVPFRRREGDSPRFADGGTRNV